ncbi:hypothetical protein GQX74_012634 [Glossina fuscipes]|nr:hypothetical protein GQX74_012634 [Glossina fuscipes]
MPPKRFKRLSTLRFARCIDLPIPSLERPRCIFNEACRTKVELISGLSEPISKSIEDDSFGAPLNQRTKPLRRPKEFLSELEVESDSKALSLCRGVRVGLTAVVRLRKLLKENSPAIEKTAGFVLFFIFIIMNCQDYRDYCCQAPDIMRFQSGVLIKISPNDFTVIVGIENKYCSMDFVLFSPPSESISSVEPTSSSTHSSAAYNKIHCIVYNSFVSTAPIACISLTRLCNKAATQCITCGRAACNKRHLGMAPNALVNGGDKPN